MTHDARPAAHPGAETIDIPLSREQFRVRLELPMGDEERDEIVDLVRWFTHRYPTPASRLAYARRDQSRSRRRARPHKEIDVEEYLNAPPKLESLELIIDDGLWKGLPISLRSDGSFRVESRDLTRSELIEGDLLLRCSLGEVCLRGATTTARSTSSEGHSEARAIWEGICAEASFRVASLVPGEPAERRWRMYKRVAPGFDDRFCFPFWYRDFAGFPECRCLLPLSVRGVPLEVLYFHDGPWLVFEGRGAFSADEFEDFATCAAQVLSYLSGDFLTGDCVLVAHDTTTDAPDEIHWLMGQQGRINIETPVPANWWTLRSAAEALQLDPNRDSIDAAVVSRCVERLISDRDLGAVVEYLRLYPGLPLVASTGMLHLAIETLVKQVEKTAAPLKQGPRLKNQDQLIAAFAAVGVTLSDEEREAIKTRNHYLHGRRHRGTPTAADENAGWRSAVTLDRLLYTAANKLLLKQLGYEGPVIDWGRIPPEKWEPRFVLI